MQSNDLFAELTFPELALLSAMFQSARQKARKVMGANWWNREVTESYAGLVRDLTAHDPLFGAEERG